MNILGVCGSIRSNYKKIALLNNLIKTSNDISELKSAIIQSKVDFANSDIAVAFSLLGVKKEGLDYKLISINDIFEKKHVSLFSNKDKNLYPGVEDIDMLHVNPEKLKSLLKDVKNSSGIVLGTPVYFGDRSSVANKFLQLTNKNKALCEKAFGVVSVGAKRNGGQETANIYSLVDALMQDCLVVGNGPPVAQYGGTLVGGDKMSVINDEFGLKTAFGTGSRVAQLGNILAKGSEFIQETSIHIGIVVTMDTQKQKYLEIAKNYFNSQVSEKSVRLTFIELIDSTIYRCVACDICPSPRHREKHINQEKPYNCIVQVKRDGMKDLQEILRDVDAIALVGVNSHEDIIYRYQAFMERTRYIRREDFELTNRIIFGVLINELGAINNAIHSIKVLTSFIRHNTFVIKPVEITMSNGKFIYLSDLDEHIELIKRVKLGRLNVESKEVRYLATGYANRELDSTSSKRH